MVVDDEVVVLVVVVWDVLEVVDMHVTTETGMFVEELPNHATPSRTILHWKLYVPGDEGAVIVNENVLLDPGEIDSPPERETLANPQFVLS